MNTLKSFIIPVRGLSSGKHHFDFQVDDAFFKAINPESNVVGSFDIGLDFDKRDRMYVLDFNIKGSLRTTCDRCLSEIDYPIEDDHQLIIKIGIGEDEAEVIYQETTRDELDVSNFVYEFILLSFPIIKNCEDAINASCNAEMLDIINSKPTNEGSSNIWEELNKLNLKK